MYKALAKILCGVISASCTLGFLNIDERNPEDEHEFIVEGPKIEKMLGYTNLEAEKGFTFFQNFLKDNGILRQLEELGIQDGDTVRMYGHAFDYYR